MERTEDHRREWDNGRNYEILRSPFGSEAKEGSAEAQSKARRPRFPKATQHVYIAGRVDGGITVDAW